MKLATETDAQTRELRPLGDRIVVRELVEDDKVGSLYVPPDSKDKPQEGTVLAVGPGRVTDKGVLVPLGIKVDQTVLYGRYSGTAVTIDGVELLIVKEADILGVLE